MVDEQDGQNSAEASAVAVVCSWDRIVMNGLMPVSLWNAA
jgi:hypothetical protein